MDEGFSTGFNHLKPNQVGLTKQGSKDVREMGIAETNSGYPREMSPSRQSDEQEAEGFLTLLPEIKGPIKSTRQLLMQDLEADGIVRRNIPFSSRRSKPGFLSPSPSRSSVAASN